MAPKKKAKKGTTAEQKQSSSKRKYFNLFPSEYAREYENELVYEEKYGIKRKSRVNQDQIWDDLFGKWLDFLAEYGKAFPNGPEAMPVWDRAQIMQEHGLDKKEFVEFIVYLKRKFWGSVANWEAMDGCPADFTARVAATIIQSSIGNVKKT
ncbi:hypothetical protein [Roseimaritima ulvae]|uniref:Uncharacterized protein n=1 Tax=Roseimaritima ulvae TaxID=980254 RepID=A0A5B9QSV6_9BACT|nr:hypothetical protein [Roseimaritima ulvae]QEG42084.1 hypothetical protein UC8_41140 [Roseimaritima ulvae]